MYIVKMKILFKKFGFFYDIYFVLGSKVMVEVATNLEIPVKILVPRIVSRERREIMLTLLGLGDLVIPGTFISLCLRYDLYKHHEQNKNIEFHHLQKFEKPYFKNSLIAYSLGLATTVGVVHFFDRGQPALL